MLTINDDCEQTNYDYKPSRRVMLEVLDSHSVDFKEDTEGRISVNDVYYDSPLGEWVGNNWIDVTNYTVQQLRDYLGY